MKLDIFEDMRTEIGCEYISDLSFYVVFGNIYSLTG